MDLSGGSGVRAPQAGQNLASADGSCVAEGCLGHPQCLFDRRPDLRLRDCSCGRCSAVLCICSPTRQRERAADDSRLRLDHHQILVLRTSVDHRPRSLISKITILCQGPEWMASETPERGTPSTTCHVTAAGRPASFSQNHSTTMSSGAWQPWQNLKGTGNLHPNSKQESTAVKKERLAEPQG